MYSCACYRHKIYVAIWCMNLEQTTSSFTSECSLKMACIFKTTFTNSVITKMSGNQSSVVIRNNIM